MFFIQRPCSKCLTYSTQRYIIFTNSTGCCLHGSSPYNSRIAIKVVDLFSSLHVEDLTAMAKKKITLEKRPFVLIIRDGWGYNPDPAENPYNAIKCANIPVDNMLMTEFPNCLIHTSGEDVGLPDGTMGNSEVGHQNIGAGRIVPQESVRISKTIRDG
jgi:hypothetical protein